MYILSILRKFNFLPITTETDTCNYIVIFLDWVPRTAGGDGVPARWRQPMRRRHCVRRAPPGGQTPSGCCCRPVPSQRPGCDVTAHIIGNTKVVGFLRATWGSDEKYRGNWGARDQVAALQWVQTHIAIFNGDPSRVTTFGNSAGGSGSGLLAISPLAKGGRNHYTNLVPMH